MKETMLVFSGTYPPIDSGKNGRLIVLEPTSKVRAEDGLYEVRLCTASLEATIEGRLEGNRFSYGKRVPQLLYALDCKATGIFDDVKPKGQFSLVELKKIETGLLSELRPIGILK
ncbi:hypothetical protein [Ruegeria atlantica]|uniref:hypothetical protein n=1 Tax=Ruegeria atlantica TaxID=81569 RepID=UPI00147E92CB|nr:hypothetical protein [Ruegeria atlantica]